MTINTLLNRVGYLLVHVVALIIVVVQVLKSIILIEQPDTPLKVPH